MKVWNIKIWLKYRKLLLLDNLANACILFMNNFQNLEIYHTDLGFMDWYQAISECNSLDDSWRLPNLQELNYLYENQNNFKGIQNGEYYWSENTDNDLNVWAKYFYTGYQCRFNKRTKARGRPVRKKTIL